MSKHFETIDAYIASLPDEVQVRVEALRSAIHAAAPGTTEEIKYNMPAFRYGGTYLVYLAAWKKHIGLYPVARGDADFEAQMASYRAEKDTVQFKHSQPLPIGLVTGIIAERLKSIRA